MYRTSLVVFALLRAQTPALQAVDRDIAQFERAELREAGIRRFIPPDRERVARARRQVEAYLRTKPDDPWALVLLARVGRFELSASRGASCTPAHGCALDSTYDDAPFHAALDRALGLRGDDAEAHFWKARLIADGRPIIRDGEFDVEVDTAQLLTHAERAVALGKRNVRYREFLAVTLTDMGRYEAAAAVIREVDRGRHPLHLILQDFEEVPVPSGAAVWPGRAAFFAVGMDEAPPRYAAQTGRAWVIAQSKDQLEAFYRRRWDAFRFFRWDVGDGGPAPNVWIQQFRPDRGGRLQPARDSALIVPPDRLERFDGLLLIVREAGPRVDPLGERYPTAVAGKDLFLEIIILNGRR